MLEGSEIYIFYPTVSTVEFTPGKLIKATTPSNFYLLSTGPRSDLCVCYAISYHEFYIMSIWNFDYRNDFPS